MSGARDQWVAPCRSALERGQFGSIEFNASTYQFEATFRAFTTWGGIKVTLLPHTSGTECRLAAWANCDNVYALFSSPTQKILGAFKSNLPNAVPAPESPEPVDQLAASGQFRVIGVDRASQFDTTWVTHAQSADNAKAKANCEGLS